MTFFPLSLAPWITNNFKNVSFIAYKWCKICKYYVNSIIISCSTSQIREQCDLVKYMIYTVLFVVIYAFFPPNMYSKCFLTSLTKASLVMLADCLFQQFQSYSELRIFQNEFTRFDKIETVCQWLYSFYIDTYDQNWCSVVVLSLGLPVYTEFPCLKVFPLRKRDCPCILAHTFGIELLVLMPWQADQKLYFCQ